MSWECPPPERGWFIRIRDHSIRKRRQLTVLCAHHVRRLAGQQSSVRSRSIRWGGLTPTASKPTFSKRPTPPCASANRPTAAIRTATPPCRAVNGRSLRGTADSTRRCSDLRGRELTAPQRPLNSVSLPLRELPRRRSCAGIRSSTRRSVPALLAAALGACLGRIEGHAAFPKGSMNKAVWTRMMWAKPPPDGLRRTRHQTCCTLGS